MEERIGGLRPWEALNHGVSAGGTAWRVPVAARGAAAPPVGNARHDMPSAMAKAQEHRFQERHIGVRAQPDALRVSTTVEHRREIR